jgi:hypothetical protein
MDMDNYTQKQPEPANQNPHAVKEGPATTNSPHIITTANSTPGVANIGETAKAAIRHEPLTRADKACLACALALSLLWTICVSPLWVSAGLMLFGGMALSVCMLAFLACAWFLRSKREPNPSAHATSRWSYVLLAYTVALMCVPGLTQSIWIRSLNACVLATVMPLTFLSLSDYDGELFSPRGVLHGIATIFVEQFRHWPVLGRVISSCSKGRGHSMRNIAIGAACASAILIVVVPWLASADENFSHLTSQFFDSLPNINHAHPIMNIIRFVLVVPITFSLLFALRHPRQKKASNTKKFQYSVSVATLNTMLVMLDAVYLVFVAIQSSYLFGGKDALDRFGGYATYARTGFFQLVAVTAINLIIVMVCIHLRKDHEQATSLLVLELVLIASTAIMLVSAVWRMSLYVGEYGLSRLRILTFWGMIVIAFLLVATVLKLFRQHTQLFRLALFGTLGLWLVFALIRPNVIIANVNVNGYLNGSIHTVDTEYIAELPHAANNLTRLKDQAPDEEVQFSADQSLKELSPDSKSEEWPLWGI